MTIGDDLSLVVEAMKKILTVGDSKYLSDLIDLTMMDRSIRLSYHVRRYFLIFL